jgi:multidrug efflux pump subunit AcrA (membrane-fusion protein)
MESNCINGTLTSISPRQLLPFSSALISALVLLALSGCRGQGENGNPGDKQKVPAAEVTVVTIAPKSIPVTFEAVGQTACSREVEARCPGRWNFAAALL